MIIFIIAPPPLVMSNKSIQSNNFVFGSKKKESEIFKVGCPVCHQEVDTYTDEGVLKIENHNYRDSELQCPGSGEELK